MGGNAYLPDHVSPPGETLQEILDDRQMSQADLASRTGRPRKTINEIIKGKAAITPETALQFERVLGVPASFWNNLERNYREHVARKDEEAALEASTGWLKWIPVRELTKRGYLEERTSKVDQVREVLNFFGVASPTEWETVFALPQANFRRSAAFTSEIGALAAWMRIGEIEAGRIDCRPFDRQKFEAALREARALTIKPCREYLRRLVEICAAVGVAVVYVPELSGSRAYGATRWLSPTKAMIQLSLRGKRDDFFWFTFFHEAAHLLFHGKRLIFVEGKPEKAAAAVDEGSDEEAQADRFAADFLIPSGELAAFRTKRGKVGAQEVQRTARRLGIAPGILVGRLQHEGLLRRSHLHNLRKRVELDT